ncbi:MAG TPA: hypothetical protein ENN41_02670, partial [Sediminispirochaeta sp.]|nr:hypothetical protein [Sediminispirochaeta sp.]
MREPRAAALSLLLTLLLLAPPVFAQSDEPAFGERSSGQMDIDEFFNSGGDEASEQEPDQDTRDGEQSSTGEEAEEESGEGFEEAAARVDLEALTTSPVKVAGKVNAGVGAGIGLLEWPASGESWPEEIRYSGLYYTRVIVTTDARPEPYLRFHGSVETVFDESQVDGAGGAFNFSTPSIRELFVDYTLADTVFFRAGKQRLTWGQGRLLGNPGNLVSRIYDGLAVRASLPAAGGTLDGLVYTTPALKGDYSEINPKAFGYAGLWDRGFGPVGLSLSGHYHADEALGSVLSLSTNVGAVELAADFVGHWDRGEPWGGESRWQADGLFVWDSDSSDWTLVGEYRFDSSVAEGLGHYGALALRMPRIGGGKWRPALRWRHAYQDHSGDVVLGLSGTVAPKLKLSLGLPVIYGEPGSYYRDALVVETDQDDRYDEEKYYIPLDNVVSLL